MLGPSQNLGKPHRENSDQASKATALKTAEHHAKGDVEAGGPTTTLPVHVSQAPSSSTKSSQTSFQAPVGVPVTTETSPGAQNTLLTTPKPPPGTGLFGSSSVGYNVSKSASSSVIPSATKTDSLFSFPSTNTGFGGQPSSSLFSGQSSSTLFATSTATSSPAPKTSTSQPSGTFGAASALSPTSGSTVKHPNGWFSGSGAVSTSSSATQSLFGGQTKGPWPTPAPTGGLFARSEPSLPSTSGLSAPKLFVTTAKQPINSGSLPSRWPTLSPKHVSSQDHVSN